MLTAAVPELVKAETGMGTYFAASRPRSQQNLVRCLSCDVPIAAQEKFNETVSTAVSPGHGTRPTTGHGSGLPINSLGGHAAGATITRPRGLSTGSNPGLRSSGKHKGASSDDFEVTLEIPSPLPSIETPGPQSPIRQRHSIAAIPVTTEMKQDMEEGDTSENVTPAPATPSTVRRKLNDAIQQAEKSLEESKEARSPAPGKNGLRRSGTAPLQGSAKLISKQ